MGHTTRAASVVSAAIGVAAVGAAATVGDAVMKATEPGRTARAKQQTDAANLVKNSGVPAKTAYVDFTKKP
jgi:hypothetical protein